MPKSQPSTLKMGPFLRGESSKTTTLWGIIFTVAGALSLAGFLFAAVISKLLPPSRDPILAAIQNDRYYCLMVPLTVPVTVVAVYFHWLSMKVFKHA